MCEDLVAEAAAGRLDAVFGRDEAGFSWGWVGWGSKWNRSGHSPNEHGAKVDPIPQTTRVLGSMLIWKLFLLSGRGGVHANFEECQSKTSKAMHGHARAVYVCMGTLGACSSLTKGPPTF